MAGSSTRGQIVEAADELFYSHGFGQTSFADIAAAVQISRGNFYYHFRTKDEILDAVIDKRLADREMSLQLSEEAMVQLVEAGYDPVYGARPLKRAILREIQNPLAESILEGGDLSAGTIKVEFGDEKFRFERQK